MKDVFPKGLQARAEVEAQKLGEEKLVRIREIEAEIRGLERCAGFRFYHNVVGNALVNALHHINRGAWDRLHNDMEIAERALANYKKELG